MSGGYELISVREHFEWAVERAEEYLVAGDAIGAAGSFASDLEKHPGTAGRAVFAPAGQAGSAGELMLVSAAVGVAGVRAFIADRRAVVDAW